MNDGVGSAVVLLGGFDVGVIIVLLGTLNDVVGLAIVLIWGFNVGAITILLRTLDDVFDFLVTVGLTIIVLDSLGVRKLLLKVA